jgi:hypothetical protein
MKSYTLRVVKSQSAQIIDHPLPLDEENRECALNLRTAPGSTALHLLFSHAQQPILRLEIPTYNRNGDMIQLRVALNDDNTLIVADIVGDKFFLPLDDHYSPLPLIGPSEKDAPLYIALAIDGTSRVFAENAETLDDRGDRSLVGNFLLSQRNQEHWANCIDKLTAFLEEITQNAKEAKVSILAFGDQSPPDIQAKELTPLYLLRPEPEKRFFYPMDSQAMKQALLAIPATSGGDFVDALADALAACASLRWLKDARKLVVVFGDSPGHSIIEPIQRGADCCVRQYDIDSATIALHQKGIEIITIYNDLSKEIIFRYYQNQPILELLRQTENQYQKIASLPELMFPFSQFDPKVAGQTFLNRTFSIARESTYGELADIQPAARLNESSSYGLS